MVNHLRVAALATRAASFVRESGSCESCHSALSHCFIGSSSPSSKGSITCRVYCTHGSVTAGSCRRVLELALPATWPAPLSQTHARTYCHPASSSSGCTVAHPISEFQNQRVVDGFEC